MQYVTERLVLKYPDDSCAKDYLEYLIRNRDFLREWEPSRTDSYFTIDSANGFLKEQLEGIISKTSLTLLISNKNDSKIIGTVSLSNIVRGVFQSCFLGYKLDADEIKKGKMSEAVKKIINIGFSELKLHRIEANIMPRNIDSIELVKKMGFTNEGLSPKYLKINDRWEDHLHFAILNDMEDENEY